MTTLLVLLALTADPWSVPSVPWLPVVESAPAEPTWTRLAVPVTLPVDPYAELHYWKTGQFYNDAHETSHFVCNWFSNSWGLYAKHQQALYCLKGRIAVLTEPPLTLAAVAAAVPQRERGSVYQLYLVDQQAGWNKTPLYILNEAVCYANEFEWDGKEFGRLKAVEMNRYAAVLLSLAEKCPSYDAGPLRIFVQWHIARVEQQAKRAVVPRTTLLQRAAACRT